MLRNWAVEQYDEMDRPVRRIAELDHLEDAKDVARMFSLKQSRHMFCVVDIKRGHITDTFLGGR